jgi:hypothetical protein
MKLLFVVFALIFSTQVYAQSATEIMAQIRAENKLRFNDKGFINSPALTARFSASQKAAVAKLRANGNLKRSFRITNNVLSDLVINISLVQETTGVVAGLLVERNKYDSANDEATLRLLNIPILLNGMNLFGYNGVTLVSVKAQQLVAEQGGRLAIRYPTNYKNNTFGEVTFDILKTTVGDMSFFTVDRKGFSRADVSVWTNIFTQNFGVDSVSFR